MARGAFLVTALVPLHLSVAASPSLCKYTSGSEAGGLHSCSPSDPAPSSTWSLSMDPTDDTRQTVDGFGAAWTDATTYVFDSLSPDDQEVILETLFGSSKDDAIKLELMRTTVGQSDLTPSHYGRWSFDEAAEPDPDLSKFSLTEPGERMLSWIMRMQEHTSSVTLLGSLWSPPGWMKQDNQLRWQYRESYAAYIVKYLTAYRDAGVEVDALTLQNEPLHSADPAWTMLEDARCAAILTNLTAAAIGEAGLGTEIWAYDHNTDHPEYPQYVLDNSEGAAAVAWHCYSGAGWDAIKDFGASNPGVRSYMTECWLHETTGEGFFDLPKFVLRPVAAGASGAMAWTLGGSADLDVSYPGGCEQCTGLVQVDMKDATYELTKDFYKLGQFSKFVQKGAGYLPVDGGYVWADGTGMEAVGFRNLDGGLVVVVLNMFDNDVQVTLDLAGGEPVVGDVKANSVTTWVL
ncbi:hypothetical protein TeGR_g1029 [Tetraparma gracilis]|uniref:Glucosylceramidase n=1 Tax=Tetraparma gracilis TaxID=2962635 RepID=A0ABQ6N8J0_9STRA|nr:hypothetical protein TeGR_g1029 [Tetraparma gracilis]